jgi:hypothetical protein
VVESAPGLLRDDRDREEGRELLFDADGAGTGPAAAVRGRERLVEVDVEDVDAHVAGTDDPRQGVHVGPVHIDEAALGVDDLGDAADVGLEDAEGVGIGHHERGDLVGHRRLEGGQVDRARVVGLDLPDRVAADVGRGGIGAVGGIRDEDVFPGVPPGLQGGPDEHHADELAVGAGGRMEREGVHAGDLAEEAFEPLEDLQVALDEVLGGEGMRSGEGGKGRKPLVDLGIVLHGAGAEGVEAQVDAVVLLGQPGEVTRDLGLGDLREVLELGAQRDPGQQVLRRGDVLGGQLGGPLAGRADLEDEGFADLLDHDRTSWRARASRSISSFVLISVTQTRAAFGSSG